MNWNGLLVNVKSYAIPNAINKIAYSTIRQPKAVRAYRYAFMLRDKQINTPEPIGYVIEKGIFNLRSSFLVTVHLPNQRDMYEFGNNEINGREEIITSLGAFAAKMHDAGFLHLDFSPGNILFTQDEQGRVVFNLVDINRMRFGNINPKMGCISFARLWGDQDFRNLLAISYAQARGVKDVEGIIKWVEKYHYLFWRNRKRWDTLLS